VNLEDPTRTNGRRRFLKTVGAGALSLCAITTATANEGQEGLGSTSLEDVPTDRLYEYSLILRKYRGWDVHEWRTWLAIHDLEFVYDGSAVTIKQSNPNDGPGTQKLNESSAKLYMTYTRGEDTDHLNVEWSLNDGWLSYAEPPTDYVSISFEGDYYNFTDGKDEDYGEYVSSAEAVDSLGHNYRVVAYDADGHAMYSTGRFGSWFDTKLYSTGGTQSTRQIYMDYHCRWEDEVVKGFSVGSDGDGGLNFGSETGHWRAETFTSEEEMDNGETYEDDNPA
jgi:hypothetical protein